MTNSSGDTAGEQNSFLGSAPLFLARTPPGRTLFIFPSVLDQPSPRAATTVVLANKTTKRRPYSACRETKSAHLTSHAKVELFCPARLNTVRV